MEEAGDGKLSYLRRENTAVAVAAGGAAVIREEGL